MEMEATPTHKSPEIVNCEGQDGGREGHNARLTLQAHNFHSNFSKTQIFYLKMFQQNVLFDVQHSDAGKNLAKLFSNFKPARRLRSKSTKH